MKILLINKFLYPKGGAENSIFQTAKLLERNGHKVSSFSMKHSRNLPSAYEKFFVSNVDYESAGFWHAFKCAGRLLYSFEAKRKISALIKQEKPDLAHLNNIYHQISPSILHQLKKHRIPMVMSLHDYKLACASYSMFARGGVCEACKQGRYYNCFLKGCVKNSKIKSLLNTIEMYLHHKILHIYDLIDVFISPSIFLKNKLEEMGFKGKIEYLPNFVHLEEYMAQSDWQENSIVYFGRLSKEKGLFTLIKAMQGLDVKLKIIGEGPEDERLKDKVKRLKLDNVRFLGYKSGEDLKEEIKRSMFVVLPSEWYENNPRSVIEAFALGKPVIGAHIGGIPELVKDNETGLTFEPGNADDLRSKIIKLCGDKDKVVEMGRNARKFVEQELNADKHYQKLTNIYESVVSK